MIVRMLALIMKYQVTLSIGRCLLCPDRLRKLGIERNVTVMERWVLTSLVALWLDLRCIAWWTFSNAHWLSCVLALNERWLVNSWLLSSIMCPINNWSNSSISSLLIKGVLAVELLYRRTNLEFLGHLIFHHQCYHPGHHSWYFIISAIILNIIYFGREVIIASLVLTSWATVGVFLPHPQFLDLHPFMQLQPLIKNSLTELIFSSTSGASQSTENLSPLQI